MYCHAIQESLVLYFLSESECLENLVKKMFVCICVIDVVTAILSSLHSGRVKDISRLNAILIVNLYVNFVAFSAAKSLIKSFVFVIK